MSLQFEELDYHTTHLGGLSLRRRRLPQTGELDIYEVKLGDEFLMSSLFTEAEEQLARLGLAGFNRPVDVVVGGLGLGFTAVAALDCGLVRSLFVIEALTPVIDWHRQGLLPLGERLTGDPRCQLVAGDFFAMAAASGFDPAQPERRFDAVLLDIDHSPRDWLHQTHGSFYLSHGIQQIIGQLQPGGVFALWSNDPPDALFIEALEKGFACVETHRVTFANPLQGGESDNTIYVAGLE